MLSKKQIILSISLSPEKLTNDIERNIHEKCKILLMNKQIKKLCGLCIDVIIGGYEVIKISDGGYCEFNVLCICETITLKIGEVINLPIKQTNEYGYYLDYKLNIFVGNRKDKKKIGENVNIKISKISFIDDKFVIIGKEL